MKKFESLNAFIGASFERDATRMIVGGGAGTHTQGKYEDKHHHMGAGVIISTDTKSCDGTQINYHSSDKQEADGCVVNTPATATDTISSGR